MLCLRVPVVSLKMWWKTDELDMISKITNVETVGGSLLKIRSGESFQRKPKASLTDCCWRNCRLQALPAPCRFPNCGCNSTNQKYSRCATEVQVRPKPKRCLTVQMDELWSFVDWHWEQAVGVACPGCANSWDCGRLHRRPECSIGSILVAVDASHLSPMCRNLQWFLVSLSRGVTQQTASCRRQGNWENKLHWAVQLYPPTTSI